MIEELSEYFESEIDKDETDKLEPDWKPIFWRAPLVILKTPVPTLRMNYGKIQCDITFSSGLGVENTKLVHHMFSLQPESLALYHFVRIWIHIDEFSFKRYMVALMVLFFLQNKKLMPTVVELQEDVPETFIAGSSLNFFQNFVQVFD